MPRTSKVIVFGFRVSPKAPPPRSFPDWSAAVSACCEAAGSAATFGEEDNAEASAGPLR